MRQSLPLYSVFFQFVTEKRLYTVLMKTLYLHYLLTSSLPLLGLLCLVLLFVFCFSAVHLARLARFGWKYTKTLEEKENAEKKEPPQETKKTAPANPSQEPIYYIVERKKQRKKPSYGEPKQIRFERSDNDSNAS